MTLLTQVKVWRKADEFTHLADPDLDPVPEIGWVTFEGPDGIGVIAGFAADGTPYHVRGRIADLTKEPPKKVLTKEEQAAREERLKVKAERAKAENEKIKSAAKAEAEKAKAKAEEEKVKSDAAEANYQASLRATVGSSKTVVPPTLSPSASPAPPPFAQQQSSIQADPNG